jgi:propionyl-CoA synthetase
MNLHRFRSRPGSCTKPCPGFKVELRGEDDKPINESYILGKIVIKLPLPPSFMLTLWGNDQAFQEKYLNVFPGYYNSGDAGYFDEDGFLYVMARIDDIINTCGHRLSTSAMEEALLTHKFLVEAAVVPINDEIRGELPFAFVVLKNELLQNKDYINNHIRKNAEIEKELINVVRKEIGPVAALQNVVIVKRLPKTRSGKTLRGVLRKIINKSDFDIPPTIEDKGVIMEIGEILMKRGFKEIGKVIEAKL